MENQSSFDLNLAIRNWREGLARSSAFQSENLNELESHLRDSIERLCKGELSDEEAFLIATRRLGPNQQLESEFGKLNRNTIWLGRAMWMLIGIQVWPISYRLMSSISDNLFALGWNKVYHGAAVGDSWPVFFSGLLQLPTFVLAVWLTWKALTNSDRLSQRIATKLRGRSSFVFCCIAASVLMFLLYGLGVFLQWELYKFSGDRLATISQINSSRVFMVMPLQTIGFATLTLLLARKRLRGSPS